MRLEAVYQPKDDEACCPTCGGAVRKRVFGEMYAGSFILDGQRVEIRREPDAEYRDPIYLDEVTQYFDGGLYRLWPSDSYLSRGGRKLHRDAWASAFGTIPPRCHIHHRDGNVLNNRLENLECMDASEHLALSRAQREPMDGGWFTAEARQKAADWHASPEGKLWHKRHAAKTKSWTKWKREEKPCQHCQKPFQALVRAGGNSSKYCSQACKVAAYRVRGKANEYARSYRKRQAAKREG